SRCEVAIVKICKTKLPLCSILPLRISQFLCEACHFRPITPHCRHIDFSVEIPFHNEAEHAEFFVGLQDWIRGDFLSKPVRQLRYWGGICSGSDRSKGGI